MKMIFEQNHEGVFFFQDQKLNFQAIIALHNSRRGPCLGGVRYYPYPSWEAGLYDVLRLSQAMTYKSALADLPLGGGKSIIFARPDHDMAAIIDKMAACIDQLQGRYYGAEDMNIHSEYLGKMAKITPFITGKPQRLGGADDPAPLTAMGIFAGLRAGLEEVFAQSDLSGLRVLIEGIGAVGSQIAETALQQGATVYISEIDPKKLADFLCRYSSAQRFQGQAVQVYMPCAVGATVTAQRVQALQCRLIAGAANNQLAQEQVAEDLRDLGVLYLPDFLINAGGVINCYAEIDPEGYDKHKVQEKVALIYPRTQEIIALAKQRAASLQTIAHWQACEQLR